MVTVVIIDIVGSTDLAERLDPEALRGVLTQYFRRRRAALEHHGGLLEKYMGDAIMGIFGVPQVHEDDPPRYPHRLRRAADAEGQGATRGGIPVALTGRPSMREGC
jgi:class 3 adenylate cyclase